MELKGTKYKLKNKDQQTIVPVDYLNIKLLLKLALISIQIRHKMLTEMTL